MHGSVLNKLGKMRSVAVLKLFSYLSWSYWNISRFCKSHKDHANNFISYHPCNVNTHNLILKLWIKGKMWQVFVSLYKIRLEEVGGLFYVCFDNSVMIIGLIWQFYTISNDDHDHNESELPSQYTLQCSHIGHIAALSIWTSKRGFGGTCPVQCP